MLTRFAVLFCFVGVPAWAQCPASPDHGVALDTLAQAAKDAPDEATGRAVSDQMWELWTDAPDAQAQALLDRGMQRREGYDFLGALEDLNALIAYCPDYAEGHNQRAFVQFLRQDFRSARVDLERALELSPNHVGARSGLALTLLALGEMAQARVELMRALDRNPWLSERHLLQKGAPLAVPGDDI